MENIFKGTSQKQQEFTKYLFGALFSAMTSDCNCETVQLLKKAGKSMVGSMVSELFIEPKADNSKPDVSSKTK